MPPPREGSGLSQQLRKHVAPVHIHALAAAAAPLDFRHLLAGEKEADRRLAQPRPQAPADPARRHRIALAAHPRDPLAVDRAFDLLVFGQPRRRQRAQTRRFDPELRRAARIAQVQHSAHELLVVLHAPELPAAPHLQRLVERRAQMMVRALHIPVLPRLAHADHSRPHPVVRQQPQVAFVELPALPALAFRVRRRRTLVALADRRRPAQLVERALQPDLERKKRLAPAHPRPLPVRERQHHMHEPVPEAPPADHHLQLPGVEPVDLQPLARTVLLRENALRFRPVPQLPRPHPPLERPPPPLAVAPRMAPPQFLEHHLRLKARLSPQHLLHLRPHRPERVLVRLPRPRRLRFQRSRRSADVLACRLAVHPGPLRAPPNLRCLLIVLHQLSILLRTDHAPEVLAPAPPRRKPTPQPGKNNCR